MEIIKSIITVLFLAFMLFIIFSASKFHIKRMLKIIMKRKKKLDK